MIKDYDGNKITPKAMAQRLVGEAMHQLMDAYWMEEEPDLTESEKTKIQAQVYKIGNRTLKKLGYEPR